MNRRQSILPAIAVGLVALALGIAALYAGDRYRHETIERQAVDEATAISRIVQQTLLDARDTLSRLTLPLDHSATPPAGDTVFWHFDGRQLDALPRKYLDDRMLRLQFRSIAGPAVYAPVTSATGRDLVLVTAAIDEGWVGVSIPADTLIPNTASDALLLASLALSWGSGEAEAGDYGIFRAGLIEGQQSVTFPVPGGQWRLEYDSKSVQLRAALQWSLYAIVFLISYVIGLVVYRFGIAPQALQGDLSRLNERFIHLNDKLRATLDNRNKVEDRVRQLSVMDIETGLPNRQSFVEQLGHLMNQMRTMPGEGPLCLAIVGLRDVENATHTVGQFMLASVLTEIVSRLRAQLPEGTYIARTNAFQLGILLPACEAEQCVHMIANLEHTNVYGIYQHRQGRLNVAPRFGIATAVDGYGNEERLLDDAISALSDAERNEQRWSLFTVESRDDRVTMLQLESEFKAAISSNEFRLYFQPIVHTNNGAPKGFECLVRWQHPVEGLLMPGRFIDLGESTGLITDLTRWSIGEAIRIAQSWKLLQTSGCYLSINLSTRDLHFPHLVQELVDKVDAAGLNPSLFRLEVTETTLIQDLAQSRRVLVELRQAGFATMLDDFGTGFSSLSYLQQLPFNVVKIDQSFTQAVESDAKIFGMLQNIVNLIHFLEMETIIEGVETSEQHDLLRSIGPNACQGYLFARPMPAVDAEEYLLGASAMSSQSASGR